MTKREKNQIYKNLLKSKNKYYGFCNALCYISEWDIEALSELMLFKPEKNRGGYWLPRGNWTVRDVILEFCINMTK